MGFSDNDLTRPMKRMSRLTARFAAAALVATALSALPASASTAENGYTPEQVCGSGFGKVTGGTKAVTDARDIVRGYVYLLYNARTGENCVVTIKSSFVGQPTLTRATLFVEVAGRDNADKFEDVGTYKSYAGPVKAQAKDICVAFNGFISDLGAKEKPSAFTVRASGGSTGFGNCGTQRMGIRGIR
ncbi:hypothetical protein AB0H88_33590 [Nonomuraea sp. NPDC050680]|uniref:hypothetical protein n=1 Tax=Nonomuraea sp. NPDC050680 TaxID=3154630 RepID=UPI0033E47F8C